MFILNVPKLEPGDIILMRTAHRKSEIIRRAAGSGYSHAMLYVGGGSVIDSDGPGVQAHNPSRMLFENSDDAIVLRLKEISTGQINKIIQYAGSKIGTEYSKDEAKKVIKKEKGTPVKNRQFCTRFVAKAYEHGGVLICEDPEYCSPKEIEQCPLLTLIDEQLFEANEAQIKYAKEENTVLNKQTEVHNLILESARKLTGEDIQTFEQIDQYLTSHPDMDSDFIKILNDSGYLELWKTDVEKNPWHYDFSQFKAHYPKAQFKGLGEQIIKQEEAIYGRMSPMHHYYSGKFSDTGLIYFEKMAQLYKKLLELNRNRLGVGIDATL